MKTEITPSQAADELMKDELNGFTRAGANALAQYIEDQEDESFVFNTTDIRCAWTQYESLTDFITKRFNCLEDAGIRDGLTSEDLYDSIREVIRDCSELIEFEGGIIVKDF